MAFTDHRGRGADHGLEFLGGIIGAAFLDIAQYDPKYNHQQDHDGCPDIAGQIGDDPRMINRMTRGFFMLSHRRASQVRRFSLATSFGPYFSRRIWTSACPRPFCEAPSWESTVPSVRMCAFDQFFRNLSAAPMRWNGNSD